MIFDQTIFSSLQNALFASLLGDEDEDKISDKKLRALNQSKSTQIRVPTGRTDIAGHRARLIGNGGWKSRTEDP